MKRSKIDLKPAAKVKRRKEGPVSPRTTSPEPSPVPPRTQTSVIPAGDRVLLAESGHSTIREPCKNDIIVSLPQIIQTTQEQQVALMLVTGLSRDQHEIHDKDMKRKLPKFNYEQIDTDGSAMIAAWHTDIWEKVSVHTLLLTGVIEGFTWGFGGINQTATSKERTALIVTLKRISTGDVPPLAKPEQIRIVLTKIHYGTQNTGHAFDAHARTSTWRSLLNEAALYDKLLIGGSLGHQNEVQIGQRLREHDFSWNPHMMFSEDHSLTCLAVGLKPATCSNHDARQLLILDISGGKKQNAWDLLGNEEAPEEDTPEEEPRSHTVQPRVETAAMPEPSPAAASQPVSRTPTTLHGMLLMSRHECLLRACDQAEDDGDELAKLIYARTTKHWWGPDGTLMMESITHEECRLKLSFALEYLHQARWTALEHMPTSRGTTDELSHEQMDVAIECMHSTFRHNYLRKPFLGKALNDWDSGNARMTRRVKDVIKSDFRSAFRAFLRDIVGDAALAYAIVRHGYDSKQAVTEIVREITIAREKAARQRQANPNAPTRKTTPHLHEKAVEARQNYARGLHIAKALEDGKRRYEDLMRSEKLAHQRYLSGELEQDLIRCNKAFGHGRGVTDPLSIQAMAGMEVQMRRRARAELA